MQTRTWLIAALTIAAVGGGSAVLHGRLAGSASAKTHAPWQAVDRY